MARVEPNDIEIHIKQQNSFVLDEKAGLTHDIADDVTRASGASSPADFVPSVSPNWDSFQPKTKHVDTEKLFQMTPRATPKAPEVLSKPSRAKSMPAQEAPQLTKMSPLEQAMRNDDMFNKNIDAPPSIICSCLEFEKVPLREDIIETFTEMVLHTARFGSVTTEQGDYIYLGPDQMDWNYHISPLPTFKNDDEIVEFRNELMKTDLDYSKPVWRSFLGETADGKGIMFLQLNHCLGDGVGLDAVLRVICKTSDGRPLGTNPALAKWENFKFTLWMRILFALSWFISFFKVMYKMIPFVHYETDCAWTNPLRRKGMVGKKEYKFRMLPELDVPDLKKIKNYMNEQDSHRKYTINDVIYGVLAGTARRYCHAKGTPLDQEGVLRSTTYLAVPALAARQAGDPRDQCYNNISVSPLPMPAERPTPIERVRGAYEAFRPLKQGAEAFCTQWLAGLLFALPSFIRHLTSTTVVSKQSTSFSNVQGPSSQVSLFGKKVLSIDCTNPTVNHSFVFVSYNNKIRGTLLWDVLTLDDEDLLINSFNQEYEALQKAVHKGKKDALVSKSWSSDSSTECVSSGSSNNYLGLKQD